MVELIYENPRRVSFFLEALDEIKVEARLNNIYELTLDLNQPPDNIIYLNLVSPSDKNLNFGSPLVIVEQYLEYLAAYNRTIINDSRSLNYEFSKVEQIKLFKRFGLSYPQTIFTSDIDQLVKLAHSISFPVVIKQNCSNWKLDKKIFETNRELEDFLRSDDYPASLDGVTILQQYIKPRHSQTTRLEIINNKFVYAYYKSENQNNLIVDFRHPLIEKYEEISKTCGYGLVGFEFVEANNGAVYTFSMKTSSSFPSEVETESVGLAKKTFQDYIKKKL